MFKTRLLSGIVLVIILIATVGTGGGLLFGFLAVISLIGLSELYKVVDVQNKILGFTGYLGAVVYYALLYTDQMQYVTLLTIAFLVVLMAVYVFSFPTFKAEQVMTVFFGVFYVAVMLSYVYQTRMLEDGAVAVWLIFLSSWGCDTCAYCAGMLLGKLLLHHLSAHRILQAIQVSISLIHIVHIMLAGIVEDMKLRIHTEHLLQTILH